MCAARLWAAQKWQVSTSCSRSTLAHGTGCSTSPRSSQDDFKLLITIKNQKITAYKDLDLVPCNWLATVIAGIPCPSWHHHLVGNSRENQTMLLEKPEVVGPHTYTDHQNQFEVERESLKKNHLEKLFKGKCLNCVSRVCTTKKERIYDYSLRSMKQVHFWAKLHCCVKLCLSQRYLEICLLINNFSHSNTGNNNAIQAKSTDLVEINTVLELVTATH